MKTVKWKTKFIEYVCCNQIIHLVIHIPLNFSYAGLHCVVIKGYSKSAGYQPGVKFEDNRFRNSWNAVYVAGAWRFVQCNWGARHLVNAKEVPKPGRAKSDSLRYILIHIYENVCWAMRVTYETSYINILKFVRISFVPFYMRLLPIW